ncbi:aldo/keto reductase [Anaeromyxobacter terrae]|uniref:aldo/keto reductase n=1 Tax=Anaeromyxobacter terrae TaxID=2925406 RepID=UPI001F5994C6|nr:aldo/keto reductase [Anaeromyxobacter sp. SG22]
MQYRSFPRSPDLRISSLGFGAMRLPVIGGESAAIDEETATAMVHEAIRAGVNYLDTAWVYHAGQSEPFLGRALRGGWRQQVQLATKCPVWEVEVEGDFDRLLDAQLERLQTDRIDFYLLHALNGERWAAMRRLGATRNLERALADGRIGHLGFSFHGALDDFQKIAGAYDWTFCQIQLNYLDERFQAGLAGLHHAAERKIGVVVMEPLRGGSLARVPPAVQAIWDRSGRGWSAASWALRWVWSLPGVVTVLSGMGSVEQVRENVASARAATPLGPDDLVRVDEAKAFYRARMAVPCTACGYCLPCPSGVDIPGTFSAYNAARMFDSKTLGAWHYSTFVVRSGGGADRCSRCAACEAMCPQSIAIPDRLEEAQSRYRRPAPARPALVADPDPE